MARRRAQNSHVSAELHAERPQPVHLLHRHVRVAHALIAPLLGQHIHLLALLVRRLGDAQLSQVAREGGLCGGESRPLQLSQQLLLSAQFLTRDNHLHHLEPGILIDNHISLSVLNLLVASTGSHQAAPTDSASGSAHVPLFAKSAAKVCIIFQISA